MDNNRSRLELLPNETFIEIFQYMDIKDLFRAFDNLNLRFNILLRSLNNLIYKLWDDKDINKNNFFPYIDTLVVHCRININLNYFKHIRHLNVVQSSDELMKQLNGETLPFLEHLFVKNLAYPIVINLYNKIFSNTFLHLKSCYISQNNDLTRYEWFAQLPLLCNLQVGIINLSVYQSILSLCPNLNFFKFGLESNETTVVVTPHSNLRRMIIKVEESIQSKNEYAINICLSFAPNLERLNIYQHFFQVNIAQYLKCDWFAPSIARYFPLLRRFNYYFNVWYLTGHEAEIISSFNDMKRYFRHVHNNRYQSKFRIQMIC